MGGSRSSATDRSMHGFVTMMDASTGMVRLSRMVSSTTSGTSVRVLGMCQERTLAGSVAPTFLYVVGMTDGTLSKNYSNSKVGVHEAFIQKIDAATLSPLWTKQVGAKRFNSTTGMSAPGSIHGLACAVTPNGTHVYMAGTVLNGASIVMDGERTNATASSGRDDLFAIQLEAINGSVVYVKQLGTTHDDRLATGEALVCDKHGNAILLGNTRGSFVSGGTSVDLANNMVLISLEHLTGDHVEIERQETRTPSISASNQKGKATNAPAISSSAPTRSPTRSPVVSSVRDQHNSNIGNMRASPTPPKHGGSTSSNTAVGSRRPNLRSVLVAAALAASLAVSLAIYVMRTRTREKCVAARYIHSGPFDVEFLVKHDNSKDDETHGETIQFYSDALSTRSLADRTEGLTRLYSNSSYTDDVFRL
jgi:hypothetical protein